MLIVLLAVFIDLVGFGLIVPILPFLTMAYGGDALMGTALVSVYSLFAFLSGPLWGRLSDRIGRKPALMMTFMGGSISYLTLAFADGYWMLFWARAMSGAMAGNVGIVMATMADLTTPETRGKAMGYVGAAFALGFAVGPGITALLAEFSAEPTILLPGLVASALSFFAMGLTWRFMPKTGSEKPASDGENQKLDGQNRALKGGWGAVVQSKRMGALMLMFVVMAMGQSINFAITPFWLNAAWGWSVQDVSILIMGIGFLIAFIQSLVLGPMFSRYGEVGAMRLGAVLFTLASLGMWWAETIPGLMYLTLPLSMAGLTAAFPAMNGEVSKRTASTLQGSALGLSNGLAALGRVAGPLVAGGLFVATSPTKPFAIITLIGFVALIWCFYETRQGAR